ncbi:MAG: hypothetical protein ABJB74_11285 [Gemmatimonas sp.]
MGAGYAAIIIRREKDLVAHFERMRATSPESAQSVQALQVEANHFFRRLETRAVIRQSPTGLYYLDQASWNAVNAMRRRVIFIVLILAVAVAAATAYTARSRLVPTIPPAPSNQ